MQEYAPGPAVQFFHGIPRQFGSSAFPASIVFTPTGDAAMDYLRSLAFIMIVVVALGVILLSTSSIVSCCACCRCCCWKECDACKRGPCRLMTLAGLVLATVALAGVGYAAAAPASSVQTGYDATVSALGGLGSFFDKNANSLGNVEASLNDLKADVSVLADRVQASSQGTPAQRAEVASQLRGDLTTSIDDASVAMNGVRTTLKGAASPIMGAVSTLNRPDLEQSYAGVLPIAAAAVFASTAVLVVLTLVPIGLCRLFHVPATVLAVFFGYLTWIVVGAVLVAGVAVSDVCIAPTAPLIGIAQESGADAILTDTVTYFTTCNATSPLPGDLSIVTASETSVASINASFATALADIRGAFAADTDVIDRADAVDASVAASVSAVSSAAAGFSCGSVRGVWVGIADAFCNKLVGDGILGFWTMELVAACLLAVVLILNIPACLRHPGQRDDADGGGGGRPASGDVTNPLPAHAVATSGLVFGEPLVKAAPPSAGAGRENYA